MHSYIINFSWAYSSQLLPGFWKLGINFQFQTSFSDFKESSCQWLCKNELTIMRKEGWFFNRIKFNVLYVFGCKYSSLKFPFKSEWWMKKVGRGFQFNNNQNLFAFLHHPNFALDFARRENFGFRLKEKLFLKSFFWEEGIFLLLAQNTSWNKAPQSQFLIYQEQYFLQRIQIPFSIVSISFNCLFWLELLFQPLQKSGHQLKFEFCQSLNFSFTIPQI